MMENEKEPGQEKEVAKIPSVMPADSESTKIETSEIKVVETKRNTPEVVDSEKPINEKTAQTNGNSTVEDTTTTAENEAANQESRPAVTDESVLAQDIESGKQDDTSVPVDNASVTNETTIVEGEENNTTNFEGAGEAKITKIDSEEDLSEKDDSSDDEDDHEEIDFSTYSKADMVKLIKELSQADQVMKAERRARQIRPFFDDIIHKEREEALSKFTADGSDEEDFEYKNDELTDRFEANYRLIRDRKIQFVKDQENRRETNLRKKQEILAKLREFVDSEETNIHFDTFKAIQNEWKEVGPVPGAHVKTLWANYNALVDRFYDNRHIYFELKELDRKKNLEAKLELCERAEALSKTDNIHEAIKELKELHHEFKHIGPVPNSEREALWQRFKEASDAVHDKRKVFIDGLKEQLEGNLEVKRALIDQVQEFTAFKAEKIKDWNQKTKELQAIQKKWDAAGGLPRAHAKEINRSFWSAFKTFYNHKSQFFKGLDALRQENLVKKKELVEKANQWKTSTDWNKAANELKKLQVEWRSIGPVPEKHRESIYHDFKAACDYFFEQKRANLGEVEKAYVENLKQKEVICAKIEEMAIAKDDNLALFREYQSQFNAIGFVPKNTISEIKSKYADAVDKYINALEGITNEERQLIRVENQINKIKAGSNASEKIYRKEQTIRKQIGRLENDIALWKNNLEFFAQSKTADKLKEEFETKIKAAATELRGLKYQLKVIRSYS